MTYAGTHLAVSEKFYTMLAGTFTWLNLKENLDLMDCWLEANPRRRPKNQKRFIVNWLQRQRPQVVTVHSSVAGPMTDFGCRECRQRFATQGQRDNHVCQLNLKGKRE